MTETIKRQIEAIRKSGETNMLDTRMVQWIANRENYFELVIWKNTGKNMSIIFLPAKRQRKNNTHYSTLLPQKQDLL